MFMKKLILGSLIALSTSAFSAETQTLTFNSMIVNKMGPNDMGITYVTNRNVKSWCTGAGSPMSFGTFEAAQTIEALADGLYSCEGKFVQIPNLRSNPIQVFEISTCTLANPKDLKTDCPK
jgi:hypothetical protein